MKDKLVFSGGKVLGIAYLGVLDYLDEHGILKNINKVAGTSVGGIAALLTSFNLPFRETKEIADTLEYKKILQKENKSLTTKIPSLLKEEIEKILGDIECLYRLIHNFGWYSTNYFYEWLKVIIANQFDASKKTPPYTFTDFKNPAIHKNNRPFIDLYVVGTDISNMKSKVFSFETTPMMEVAEAVRISMSIPFFFEAIKVDKYNINENTFTNLYADGGITRNYPIDIFDYRNTDYGTLGIKLKEHAKHREVNNLIDYITNIFLSVLNAQQDNVNHDFDEMKRTIEIDAGDVSPFNFDITPDDDNYKFLYEQGYKATSVYFKKDDY